MSNQPSTHHEEQLRQGGYTRIAGVDEAGRGALAGPVVAAAVVMPWENAIEGIRDSKLIREVDREKLYVRVTEQSVCWGVGIVGQEEIDIINIRQATLLAMRRAIEALSSAPDYAIIDGNDNAVQLTIPHHALIDGDALCYTIAAASIIAKVTRDRIMQQEHINYPHYGFDRHKGYGTAQHRTAILTHGILPLHRKSFLKKLTGIHGSPTLWDPLPSA